MLEEHGGKPELVWDFRSYQCGGAATSKQKDPETAGYTKGQQHCKSVKGESVCRQVLGIRGMLGEEGGWGESQGRVFRGVGIRGGFG